MVHSGLAVAPVEACPVSDRRLAVAPVEACPVGDRRFGVERRRVEDRLDSVKTGAGGGRARNPIKDSFLGVFTPKC